ncbi:MAG: hypothetical protein HRU18_08855 [Pseudoalteromonas sp.]|uniref:bacteriophage antitermination protein Q n=1 Tax=Pseudoalteromonas sp. TaxID=53249 RepID=UPI001DB6F32F|nr:bacteriophage antitermination protein Q [Pseudoalteromonas sp.]NRA78307.1 hypothetical protein [Pseudoalteromonas sp.]
MLCSQTQLAVRNEITEALNVHAFTRGQLDFDGSMITNPHTRPVNKDKESGERIYTDPVRGLQTNRFKKPSCPVPANIFFLTKITRAINLLDEQMCSLAYFAYCDDAQWQHTEVVAAYVWRRFLDKQTKAFRKKKTETLKSMVFLAMQDWRSVTVSERVLHGPKRIRELLGINEHHWVRDWLPHWQSMHQVLDGINNKLLTEVFHATQQRRTSQTA